MIEEMIVQAKQYLPLKISEVLWDGTIFQIYGKDWNFTTLSAWRISTKNKVLFGCFDKESIQLINSLKGAVVSDISFQTEFLKVDPVFILNNNQRIEVFSTDTFEPWTFQIGEIGVYTATPSEPDAF